MVPSVFRGKKIAFREEFTVTVLDLSPKGMKLPLEMPNFQLTVVGTDIAVWTKHQTFRSLRLGDTNTIFIGCLLFYKTAYPAYNKNNESQANTCQFYRGHMVFGIADGHQVTAD